MAPEVQQGQRWRQDFTDGWKQCGHHACPAAARSGSYTAKGACFTRTGHGITAPPQPPWPNHSYELMPEPGLRAQGCVGWKRRTNPAWSAVHATSTQSKKPPAKHAEGDPRPTPIYPQLSYSYTQSQKAETSQLGGVEASYMPSCRQLAFPYANKYTACCTWMHTPPSRPDPATAIDCYTGAKGLRARAGPEGSQLGGVEAGVMHSQPPQIHEV